MEREAAVAPDPRELPPARPTESGPLVLVALEIFLIIYCRQGIPDYYLLKLLKNYEISISYTFHHI